MPIITAAVYVKWFSANLSKLRQRNRDFCFWLIRELFFPLLIITKKSQYAQHKKLHLCVVFFIKDYLSGILPWLVISCLTCQETGLKSKEFWILKAPALKKHRLINCLSENHRFFSEYQSLKGFSRLVSKITQECSVTVRVMMADHWRVSDCNGSQLISCITAVIFTLFITSSMCSVRFKIFKSVICQHYEVNAHTLTPSVRSFTLLSPFT